MIVPTPDQIVRAQDDISRPGLGNGSAHPLHMTDEEMWKAKRREKKRQPFGFGQPTRKGGKS